MTAGGFAFSKSGRRQDTTKRMLTWPTAQAPTSLDKPEYLTSLYSVLEITLALTSLSVLFYSVRIFRNYNDCSFVEQDRFFFLLQRNNK